DVARRLEIRRVVVPRGAAVLSAWGMLATDLRYETVRTHIGDARKVGAPQLRPGVPPPGGGGGGRAGPAVPAAARGRRGGGAAGGRHAIRRADLRGRRVPGRRRPRRAGRDEGDRRALPPSARGAVHLLDARPGGRPRERTAGRGRRAARPARGAGAPGPESGS